MLSLSAAHVHLTLAIFAEVIATSSLKASDGLSRPLPTAIVVIGYATAFYFLSLALRSVPVGLAYAIWSGAGIVLVSLAGWALFGQKIDLPGAIGIALILAGVLVLNLFSRAGH
jgi:small multidrug resistance pump